MSEFGYHPRRHLRPIAVDGEVVFLALDTEELASEAEWIFGIQWDFIHGNLWAEDLDQLPEFFEGRRVVRTARELTELARIGAFAEIEEIYRELYE